MGEGKKERFGDATHVLFLVLGASYIHCVKILAFVYQGFVQLRFIYLNTCRLFFNKEFLFFFNETYQFTVIPAF